MIGDVCRKCKVLLTSGNYVGKTEGNICRSCWRTYWNTWARKTGHYRGKRAHYLREHYLGQRVNGKKVYIRTEVKRPHTGFCEMCSRRVGDPATDGKTVRRLVYHHWDDSDYSLGLWLCQSCHNVAHAVEENLAEKYLRAKDSLLLKRSIQTK